jgi:hypothetical protein
LAIIVLPIAGNACEHVAAVMVAAKNKMDLSLGIALGSSLQVRQETEITEKTELAQYHVQFQHSSPRVHRFP